ncbi:MAG: ABC transporter ATP-binding protein [Actinomycetota bacterium]
MPAVEVSQVSKRFKLHHERYTTMKEKLIHFRRARKYEEFWALRDVDFGIEPGQTFGIVGANGSGKTTMLKIIAGILTPTSGEVRIDGRIAALLELGAGFHPDLTGRENVYLNGSIMGLSRKQIDRTFDSIVDFAELHTFIDNPVRNYSSGMFVRLGFAVAVHLDPDILLVDEVLAVGDEAFQDKCLRRIREFQSEGRTIILVTHAVDLVREMCDEAVWLDHGVMAGRGNPTDVVRGYREKISTTPAGEKVQVVGAVEIEEVKLFNDEMEESQVHLAGHAMTVAAEIHAREFVADPIFSVNIHDSAGQHIFGTNTNWRFLRVALDPGPARLRIEFPMLPMREGLFTLTIGVHSRDGLTIYAATDRSTRFEMHSDSEEPGRLFLPAGFALEGAAVRKEASA